MKSMNDVTKKRIDMFIKVTLVTIIIILLIHNCKLMKDEEGRKNSPVPNGNVDIIEIDCDDKDKCEPVKPTPKNITSLSFSSKSVSVKVGNRQKLVVIVKPSSLASTKLTWKSSDPSIATVDSNGVITGLKTGTVTITVTSPNGVTATCTVHVTAEDVKVDKITLEPSKMAVKVGDAGQISAKIEPENATERDLIWTSSDTSIATVDENGVVKGLKDGTVTIRVQTKDGKVVSTCVVNVETVKVDKIVLNPTKLTVKVGGSGKISAKVEPEDATNKDIVWESSDPSIATVDENGVVKGLKAGTVTITAKTKDGKVKSVCTVNIETVKVDKITLTPTEMTVKEGTSGQVFAKIEPENATDKDLVWESSDPSVAKVDNNGKVTGIKSGTATITAKTKDGKVKSTCTVKVTTDYVEVEEIILSLDDTNIATGTYEQIIATIKPENATDRELTWSSSDDSIATVDENGKVTGVSEGTVTITAKTKDGKVKGTITITVVDEDDGSLDVYDNDKDPITWNGSDELNIFDSSIYNIDGVIAPESENTYQFVVKNNTKYKIKYSINFIETNEHEINMRYKLRKNDTYIINSYSKPNALAISDYTLNSGENDTYYLNWKWVSSDNDTEIGASVNAIYKLKIEVKAESING